MTQTDNLVADYLARVERAAAGLRPDRREELLRDLREHIAVERAESGDDSETHVRTVLERLGDPEAIAAAADTPTGSIPVPGSPTPGHAAYGHAVHGHAAARPAPTRRGNTWVWVLAGSLVVLVLLVCAGSALFLARSDSGPAPAEAPAPVQTTPFG
ncbi:hypothetical protein AMIS_21940 [Actinoplanes missouriensis 431]|uniref:Uncharacterized protein n=1 Tax=Actinoplanes missouriensis (strain ATCC 14538 / DSM 43046 / CBS 188.64 / JCM 3121 / NBRC 102363 / NCIMB 12654 / NRRL B-3342 / UNCC 431) TaxID=512565 RepID=I0H327_ACTM4|nr:hypothetical protein [Actinoplanes missouriensis]BAL87414.1 hypothetical protein AMIS_21940 [Actinoplanes missouriensis 431]